MPRKNPEEAKKYLYEWRNKNKEKHLLIARNSYYRNKIKVIARNSLRDQRKRDCKFTDELTELVHLEAHDVRLKRNKLTGIEWHVDHIIPLQSKQVCGLHIWSNLQVIPKQINLRKGNKFTQEV